MLTIIGMLLLGIPAGAALGFFLCQVKDLVVWFMR